MKQENKQKIFNITMHPERRLFCPLGEDWYTASLHIEFTPDRYYPDYCDVDKWLNKNINEQSLTIEDAVRKVNDYLQEEYHPKDVTVTAVVNDATHMPVEVTVWDK